MIDIDYISIDKDAIPYKFELTLSNTTYQFLVKYNTLNDFFTVDLYKEDIPIVLGEKIIYGKPLFTTSRYLDVPKYIIPYDTTNKSNNVTFENMNEDVFLFVIGDEDVD